MEFPTYGKCFSFIWNSTSAGKLIIEANKTYRVCIENISKKKKTFFFRDI
jgi:hypothetical protein